MHHLLLGSSNESLLGFGCCKTDDEGLTKLSGAKVLEEELSSSAE
jgi:hypothetical protein